MGPVVNSFLPLLAGKGEIINILQLYMLMTMKTCDEKQEKFPKRVLQAASLP
jgi:hypothetical protein